MSIPLLQPHDVHWSVAFGLFSFLLIPQAFSQDQERSLVNRLLRPDTEMQNSAQNKKFSADQTSIQKRATIGSFYVQEKPLSRQFSDSRTFASSEYTAKSFRGGKRQANTSSRNLVVNSNANYATGSVVGTQTDRESTKSVNGQVFTDQRKFSGKGKSQQALNRKNRPMTIEEVRELLNKNK